MNDLVVKYDVQGPRYTSYPPVPFWEGAPTTEQWWAHLEQAFAKDPKVDVYIHAPFCEKLCYYCGCHRFIRKNNSQNMPYLENVVAEWDIYRKRFPNMKISSIHLGGGTPTFFSPEELEYLFKAMDIKNLDIGAVELDPRTCKLEHLELFKKWGIGRLSMGVQDFDPYVQEQIHREQSFELVQKLVGQVRALGFESLNFDLIYGLPGQNLERMNKTLDLVATLAPESIAFYSYAHVPWKIKNQKLIKEELLPLGTTKYALYEMARNRLRSLGFTDIGLDHFARPGSYLYKSFQEHKLQRSFMGYTDQKRDVLIGLGVSSISSSTRSFIQNVKELDEYSEALAKGQLPVEAGHVHTDQDLKVQALIQQMMCQGNWPKGDESQEALTQLQDMAADGLVNLDGSTWRVTELGRNFLRNMAMLYDHRLKAKSQSGPANRFSRTV